MGAIQLFLFLKETDVKLVQPERLKRVRCDTIFIDVDKNNEYILHCIIFFCALV